MAEKRKLWFSGFLERLCSVEDGSIWTVHILLDYSAIFAFISCVRGKHFVTSVRQMAACRSSSLARQWEILCNYDAETFKVGTVFRSMKTRLCSLTNKLAIFPDNEEIIFNVRCSQRWKFPTVLVFVPRQELSIRTVFLLPTAVGESPHQLDRHVEHYSICSETRVTLDNVRGRWNKITNFRPALWQTFFMLDESDLILQSWNSVW